MLIENLIDIYKNIFPFSTRDKFNGLRKKILPSYINELISDLVGTNFPSVFDETKTIMIHVPKVAGTSMSESLYGTQVGHSKISEIKTSHPEKYSLYYKFGFVRNPYERLYSAYIFAIKGGTKEQPYNGKNITCSFEEFVLKVLPELDVAESNFIFQPQYLFLCINGKVSVDFVGRLENIEDDYEIVLQHIGLRGQLSKKNVTSSDMTGMYSESMKEVVRKVYSKDFEIFGYSDVI